MGKKTRNTDRRSSARRKLIPAVAMMMTSAAMLTTSTYAWFTMSKEVSVSSIQLTASVPETLEISLGKKEGSTINAPDNTNATGSWSNTVDFSTYYNSIDKLKPASSTDGVNIYYTGDAAGDGTILSQKPKFTKSTSANEYYIDLPVWFRTSTKSADVDLIVKADVSGSEIRKAARVAVLDENSSISKGIICPSGYDYINVSALKVADRISIVKDMALKSEKNNDTEISTSNYGTYYDEVSVLTTYPDPDPDDTKDPDTVATVPKRIDGSEINYGAMTKIVLRVWIEGEDAACFNPNAGQNFNIALTFYDKNQITTS